MTTVDTQKIADFIETHRLSKGLGTMQEPCSIGAINIALTGRLSDEIPECMSLVIGKWIREIQDSMPDEIRNSSGWKSLLSLAAGTGRDTALEQRREALLLDWMWVDVLPQLQPIADASGFGAEWCTMLTDRTLAWVPASPGPMARVLEWANAAMLLSPTTPSVPSPSTAATWVATEAARVARCSSVADFWTLVDPVAILRKLVDHNEGEA